MIRFRWIERDGAAVIADRTFEVPEFFECPKCHEAACIVNAVEGRARLQCDNCSLDGDLCPSCLGQPETRTNCHNCNHKGWLKRGVYRQSELTDLTPPTLSPAEPLSEKLWVQLFGWIVDTSNASKGPLVFTPYNERQELEVDGNRTWVVSFVVPGLIAPGLFLWIAQGYRLVSVQLGNEELPMSTRRASMVVTKPIPPMTQLAARIVRSPGRPWPWLGEPSIDETPPAPPVPEEAPDVGAAVEQAAANAAEVDDDGS